MPPSTTACSELSTDIVIFGGGIAGLWILNHLKSLGYSVLLLETSALGQGQSIASQGIIHGGLKYALGGSVSNAAAAIAGMPARWRNCLAGKDRVDLSDCRLLSENYFMWSEGSYRSRLKAFLGSRTLRGKIDPVEEKDYPSPMAAARGQGSLYRLPDFVIDTPSLLATLARDNEDLIFRIDPSMISFPSLSGNLISIETENGSLSIQAQRIVLAAGEGNAGLLQLAGLKGATMQTRPLNMVMLRSKSLPHLFVHCIGDSFSLTPRLTLTSHPCIDGEVCWYLGGDLAETGVERSDTEQLGAARRILGELFPWVDTSDARWACLRVNRAEGREAGSHRPDSVFLKAEKSFLVSWPTKFTLSPALADEVAARLVEQGIEPGNGSKTDILSSCLQRVSVAQPPWETCFD